MFIKIKEFALYIISIIFVLFLDLYSKYIIKQYFLNKKINSVKVFDFLNIVYVENHGIVFGLLQNVNKFLIFLIIGFVFFFVFDILKKETNKKKIFLICLITGGGLGNVIDRIFNGYVFDFIDFHIKTYHWYVFNVADSFITISGIFLVIFDLRKYVYFRNRSCSK